MLCQSPHIVIMTETWLTSDVKSDCVIPPNYKLIRKDRASRGGGVAIAVKINMQCVVLDHCLDDMLFCKIKYGDLSFLVVAAYRAPNSPIRFLEDLDVVLNTYANDNTRIVLAGDFNLPHVNWDLLHAGSVDKANCEKMLEIAFGHSITQVVKDFTRVTDTTQSVLDLIFLSDNIADYKVSVVDGISDHKMVLLTIKCDKTAVTSVPCRLIYKDFESADDTSIIDYLELSFNSFELLCHSGDVQSAWNCFKEIVFYCINKYVPNRIKKTKRNNPWITRNIIHIKRRLKRCRKKNGNSVNMRQLSQQLKDMVKASKHSYYTVTLQNFLKNSPQKFWRHLNPKKESIEQITLDGRVITDTSVLADSFNLFFQSVFTREAQHENNENNGEKLTEQNARNDSDINARSGFEQGYDTVHTMPELIITKEGILSKLLDLDTKKAFGPDKIPNMFLRRYAEWMSFYLHCLFVSSLQSSQLPTDWRCARVVPIFKAGDKLTIDNYRPISLTSVACKVMEHIIAKHILHHLDTNQLLYSKQHGFRSGLSTVTQLVETAHDMASILNDKQQLDVISIDFSKAFDRVPHRKLLSKLKTFGIEPMIINWINSYLTNRSQSVEINGHVSNSLPVYSGVPQGSVLGPLLFLMYINDIAHGTPPHIHIRLFADDCIIYSAIKSQDQQRALNDYLDHIEEWCDHWDMKINFTKSVYCHITKKRSTLPFQYCIGNTELGNVESFKYLGVTFTRDLTWSKHIDNICSSAYKKLCFLRHKLKHATKEIKTVAYKTYVRPILEYASVVWDPYTKKDIESLEKVQRQAARFIHCNYRQTASPTEMLRNSNLEPLHIRREIARLKLLFLIINDKLNLSSSKYVLPSSSKRSSRLNHTKTCQTFKSRIDTFKQSFFVRTIEAWNQLPSEIVNIETVSSLEQSIAQLLSQ